MRTSRWLVRSAVVGLGVMVAMAGLGAGARPVAGQTPPGTRSADSQAALQKDLEGIAARAEVKLVFRKPDALSLTGAYGQLTELIKELETTDRGLRIVDFVMYAQGPGKDWGAEINLAMATKDAGALAKTSFGMMLGDLMGILTPDIKPSYIAGASGTLELNGSAATEEVPQTLVDRMIVQKRFGSPRVNRLQYQISSGMWEFDVQVGEGLRPTPMGVNAPPAVAKPAATAQSPGGEPALETDAAVKAFITAAESRAQVQHVRIEFAGDRQVRRVYGLTVEGRFEQVMDFIGEVEAAQDRIRISNFAVAARKPQVNVYLAELALVVNTQDPEGSPRTNLVTVLQEVRKLVPANTDEPRVSRIVGRAGVVNIAGQAGDKEAVMALNDQLAGVGSLVRPHLTGLSFSEPNRQPAGMFPRAKAWTFAIEMGIKGE